MKRVKGMVGGGVAATVLVGFPMVAYATGHSVQTPRGDHMLAGEGQESEEGSSTTEHWWDLATSETDNTPIPWDFDVCDYTGEFVVYNPDGSYANLHSSRTHSGCSLQGWFFHDDLDGVYAENKRFTAKWTSDQTGGSVVEIGTLVD